MNKKTRVALNSVSNIADFIVSIVITLVMTPIYLGALGKHDYGIWELIVILIGYMGLLDLGIRTAIIRYCSLYLSSNLPQEIKQLYATALIYMSSIGLICLTGVLIWSQTSPASLSADGNNIEKYSELLIWVGLAILLSFIRNTSEGMIEGCQKYLLKNALNLFIKISVAVYLWANLNENSGILLMIKVAVTASACRIAVFNVILLKSSPTISPLSPPSLTMLTRLIKFGAKSLINGVASTVQTSSGAFLIGILMGPASIPLYSIPSSLCSYIYNFIEAASKVLVPYFVELDQTTNNQIAGAYMFFSKVLVWAMFSATSFTYLFGGIFIDIWLPGEFNKDAIQSLLSILILSIFVQRLNPLALKLSSAKNKHAFFAKVRPFAAAITFGLSYILIPELGVSGAAMASCLTACVFSPIFAKHSFGLIEITFLDYWKHAILPNIPVLAALICFGLVYSEYFAINDFLALLGLFASFSALSIVAFFMFSLSKSDREKIKALVKR